MDGPTGTTCDRCGPSTRASATFTRGGHAIDCCDHHSREHGPTLVATGWVRRQLAVPGVPDVGASAIHGS